MFERTVTPDDLARLKREREEADRRYHEALAHLDRAVLQVGDLPHPPPGPDETQVTPLNTSFRIGEPPAVTGWRGRLARAVWRIVAPSFARQEAFNAALVDHLNRNIPVARQVAESADATLQRLRIELERLAAFQTLLIAFVQQITAFVDTKDREFAGLGRRVHEDNAELIDLLDNRSIGLAGALSGVSDELLKRWESMVAREERFNARTASLAAAHETLRASVAAAHQVTHVLKRELERLPAALAETGTARAASAHDGPTVPSSAGGPTPATAESVASSPLLASRFDSYKYVGFEDRFRGSPEEIRQRLADYLPYFDGASDVLDVGCGRGEFLELLAAHGVTARGIDVNHEMVEGCRARGLSVDVGDAVGYLTALPDASLGGLVSMQVVEHLEPDYLLRYIDVAFQKLRPGARIILETINPTCWFAFFQSYLRDITHVQPVHPETLAYFLTASGFQRVAVHYRVPYPEAHKLQRIAGEDVTAETFNANVDKLNQLLFTYLDYAAIGERL